MGGGGQIGKFQQIYHFFSQPFPNSDKDAYVNLQL